MKKLREYKKTNVILSAVIFLVVGAFLTVNALAAWQSSGGDTYHTSGSVAVGTNANFSTRAYIKAETDTKTPGLTVANSGTGDAAQRFALNDDGISWAMGINESDNSFRLTYKNTVFAKLNDTAFIKVNPNGDMCFGTGC